MPLALYALTAGAFGIGVTEFVIMGLLLEVSADLGVTISSAGLLISGYALGVVAGAPLLGAFTGKWPRKTLLMSLMVVFTLGNLACALAPDYWSLMAARVLTAFAHASFFGVGSVVATGLVAPDKLLRNISRTAPPTNIIKGRSPSRSQRVQAKPEPNKAQIIQNSQNTTVSSKHWPTNIIKARKVSCSKRRR